MKDNLEPSNYSQLVREMQGKTTTTTERKISPGTGSGLHLILDQNSNRFLILLMCVQLFFVIFRISDGTVFTSLDGFRLFLGQPSEFPLLRSNHILLRPGLGHSVQVSASHVSTDTSSDPPGIMQR